MIRHVTFGYLISWWAHVSKSFPPYPSIPCSGSSSGIWPLSVWQSLAVVVLVSVID